MGLWFSEYYPSPEVKLSIKIKNTLFSGESEYQKIDVYETDRLGTLMVLDGFVMVSDMDEFVYHEMISHPALIKHPKPQKVLVVGGGDGGTVREVVRHADVKEVFLVEIDEMVTKVSKEFLPHIAGEVDNPKVTARFEDAVDFVAGTREKFDVILIDSTDPISIGEGLFTTEFYSNCKKILNPGGILVAQSESAFYTPHLVPNIYKKISGVFQNVQLYRATIPTYPSGDWYFTMASDNDYRVSFHEDRFKNLVKDHQLKYYNREIHAAAFALPNFVLNLLNKEKAE